MTDVQSQAPDWHLGLPRRIAIGAYTYRIQIVPRDHAKLEAADGISLLNEFRILFAEDIPFQRAAEVVHHEMSHCINWVYGVQDETDEEQFTTQNSKGWTDVRLRNPRLDNWMTKTLRRMRKESNHD